MSLDNFIPTLWAVELLENLNDAHVYVDLLNRDYEGQISNLGDTVKINSIGRVTINTYTKNSGINAPETLDDSQLMLAITEAKYYNFEIDDIDKKQQQPKLMRAAMEEAGWGLSDTADAFVAALLEADVDAGSKLTAATSVGTGATDDDAYELLVDLGVMLDENNVPGSGRWVVIPPWYRGMLLKDPRFVSFGTSGNLDRLRNGQIGEAAGFTIAVSNNVPVSSSDYTVIAGHKLAATFAEQINDPEGFRPEDAFGDAMKGLHLYGAKVPRPYALASVVATSA
jgi:N4-gp56 family major capsid protein